MNHQPDECGTCEVCTFARDSLRQFEVVQLAVRVRWGNAQAKEERLRTAGDLDGANRAGLIKHAYADVLRMFRVARNV